MTNKEKAKNISDEINCVGLSCEQCRYAIAIKMADWKDKQPILELEGWHTEEPTEDGWYLVFTPDFPKNCYCVVAEWDNDAKCFFSEASDYPIDFRKWKLIERR